MKAKYFGILATGMALTTLSLVFGASSPDSTLKDVAGYRNWTRIGEKPIAVAITSFAG
jgi:hypothetical protein